MKLTEENYVQLAEEAIKELRKDEEKKSRGNNIQLVTTSKIRNLLAMTADIYNDVINSQKEQLSKNIVGRINYMKIHFVYEAGREEKVRALMEKAEILEHLDEIQGNRTQYILFSRYMEALVK